MPSSAVSPQAGGTYHAVSPSRVLDTRNGNGSPTAPLGPGGMLTVQVGGRAGVPPSGVSAVVVNVTVTDTTAASFLTIWPTGSPLPVVSSLNWVSGTSVANLIEVALGSGGRLNLYNLTGQTDAVMDVEGWVGDATNSSGPLGMFNSIVPSRLWDTRYNYRAPPAPIGPGGVLTVPVTAWAGVPAGGVSAVVLNVTVTDATASSFLTIWPAGSALPLASNMNWTAGQTVPNRVIVPVGTNGQVSFYNLTGSVDVVVDIDGWFTDAGNQGGGSGFVAIVPTRQYDERKDPNGPLSGFRFQAIDVTNPLAMTAAVLNVTVTDTTASSYLTVMPSDELFVATSDLDWVAGETVPNMVVVRVNLSGIAFNGQPMESFAVFNHLGLVDVVVDLTGFYTGLVQPLSPAAATARQPRTATVKP
jgi:hypothetical protein